MTDIQQKAAAKQFIKDWTGHGDEKQETQRFWMALLQKVYGVAEPDKAIEFEVRVKLDHTSFIDGYIKDTHVLIEQKGADIDLKKGYKQSDGSMLTPFQQARRYAGYLPHNMNPRWIVVCNFKEFHIHDMNRPNDTPEVIKLEELATEYTRLQFLVDTGNERIQKEMQISLQAGELVGKLYDALLKQYNSPASEAELKSLNMLCVRLVFCLYAEDAGIFGSKTMFHDYLKGFQPKNVRKALIDLFRVLDTKVADRDPYMDDDLAAFPYVNGGLFADENIIVPRFTEEIIDLLLTNASEDFNWSQISPTIFGAVFESTLNPETRRSGGMHYTSIENIHKVIDPLFFDALSAELDAIEAIAIKKTRENKLAAFQKKLASLTFLDPACGSGNFLTETYLSLRRLENKAVMLRLGEQIVMGDAADFNPIQVSIGQFYGIEINDFAVTVAKTALWIAESQMMKETEEIVHMHLDFLPLTSYANIVEGNALRIDWETVVPKDKLNYIMGNPPFVGARLMEKPQKDDMSLVFGKLKGVGNLDYVSAWYKKAADLIKNTEIRVAFVSTNSITQGEQTAILWKPIMESGIVINFAWRTFKWESQSNDQAAVHCVIVGFSCTPGDKVKKLYQGGQVAHVVKNVNAYLLDAPDIFVLNRSKALCNIPAVNYGSFALDDGNYTISEKEYAELKQADADIDLFIRPFIGAQELLHNKKRYCVWLKGLSPALINAHPVIKKKVENVRVWRSNSSRKNTVELANTPTLFAEIRQPDTNYLAIPTVCSENRRYIPMAFLTPDIVSSNQLYIVSNAELYHFGILTSNVHMAWMRAVCGRLEMRYRYSSAVVYNNFPWPTPTEAQKAKIEQTAQAILDARALCPDCSLADLYDEAVMPPELRKAHQQNDRAVMQAYGFWGKLNTETECVAELMKMYQGLTSK